MIAFKDLGCKGSRDVTPRMENQIEKEKANDMKTMVCLVMTEWTPALYCGLSKTTIRIPSLVPRGQTKVRHALLTVLVLKRGWTKYGYTWGYMRRLYTYGDPLPHKEMP